MENIKYDSRQASNIFFINRERLYQASSICIIIKYVTRPQIFAPIYVWRPQIFAQIYSMLPGLELALIPFCVEQTGHQEQIATVRSGENIYKSSQGKQS